MCACHSFLNFNNLSFKNNLTVKESEIYRLTYTFLSERIICRWLDHALENGCTATEVMEVKFLLKTLPLWAFTVVYFMVYNSALANPFFFISSDYYKYSHIGGVTISVVTLQVARKSSEKLSSFLYDILLQDAARMKIILGILSHILCYFVAWQVEDITLKMCNDGSILWLFPQFILMGIGQGLTTEGIKDLLELQFTQYRNLEDDRRRRYKFLLRFRIMFEETAVVSACILAIVYILITSHFTDTFTAVIHCQVNLSKFYKQLTLLDVASSCICCGVLYLYGTDSVETTDEEDEEST